MSDCHGISRRAFGRGLFGAAALLTRSARGQTAPPSDRGIGGTGAAPEGPEGDRGIGGTGVIGTIRRFGSIIVNGLRIAYPDNVVVTIDGVRRTASDLRVGHVVRVVAEQRGSRLSTRRIDIRSEVVGRIQSVGTESFTLLDQTVLTGAAGGTWHLGDRVAVHGQRRPDGTIVASLVERRDDGPARISGPVVRTPDGDLAIGSLRLSGLEPALVGRRAVLEGTATDDGFAVARAADDREPFGAQVRRLSIEAFVERERDGVRLGSGLAVAGAPPSSLPRTGAALAVITGSRDPQGRTTIDALRIDRREGAGRPGHAGPGQGGPGQGGPGGAGPGGGAGGRGGPGGDRPPGSRGGSSGGARSGGPGAGSSERPSGFGPASPGGRLGPTDGSFGPGSAGPPSGGFGSGPGGFGSPGGGFGGSGGFGGPGGPGGFGGPGSGRR